LVTKRITGVIDVIKEINMGIAVAEWGKGNGDVIRVELTSYRGHDMISIRTWRLGPGGEDQPLKNGINLTVKHLPKLVKALRRARKKATEAGLLRKSRPW
jgi:transcriptional coactivator p15 (PC4)